jgi:hypothetical protein
MDIDTEAKEEILKAKIIRVNFQYDAQSKSWEENIVSQDEVSFKRQLDTLQLVSQTETRQLDKTEILKDKSETVFISYNPDPVLELQSCAFINQQIIGSGGFGQVYSAFIGDLEVALKISKPRTNYISSRQSPQEMLMRERKIYE